MQPHAAVPNLRLRVVSFNLRNGIAVDPPSLWWRRRRAALAALRGLDADVVATQEGWDFQLRWLADRLGRGVVRAGRGRGARGGGEFAAVLVTSLRFRITEEVTRWYGPTPGVPGTVVDGAGHPRIATICELVHSPSMTTITLANTHLDERSPQRRLAAAEQLAGWLAPQVADRPVVLTGDLNCEADAPELAPLRDLGLRAAVDPAEGGTAHDYTDDDERRLDHVFVNDRWGVERGEVCRSRPRGRYPSDHWPILADLFLVAR